MKIVLLGSGNVATHLAGALHQAPNEIIQVWSRNRDNAEELAFSLNVEALTDLQKITTEADLYILAVKDDAIAEIAQQLSLTDQLLIHTSGSTDIRILEGISKNYGVFYPLQTFSKQQKIDFKTVPVVVEGNSPDTASRLLTLARQLSGNVIEANSEKRLVLHLAAVFACNFTNYMYALSEKILYDHGLEFELLRPLIAETAAKVQKFSPAEAQTGPALRNDSNTIDKHLHFLKNKPELYELYDKLSKEIINFYKP